MQGKSKLVGSLLALLVVVGAVLYMAGSFSNKQVAGLKTTNANNYHGKRETVLLQKISRSEWVPGSIIAKQNTQISSRVMAQVERLSVRAGDKVTKGDLLITLQQDDFKAQLAQSEAQINAIQAALTQATKQLKRIESVYAQGLVSLSELDNAKANFDSLSANLIAAKQQQTQAKVALSYTRITAPISGVVVERLVEPGDTATPGQALLGLYVKKQGQYEIKAYPALVDKKSTAAVELFDNEIKAQLAHQQGLRRLVLLNVPSPIKYLQQNLPNKAKLGLYFNPFGKIADLIDDCIASGVDSLLVKYGDIRTSEAFETVKEHIRGELGDTVVGIATQVEQVLSIAHALHKKMKGRVDLTMITAHGDIKSQLESLIFKGFVSQHGADKLVYDAGAGKETSGSLDTVSQSLLTFDNVG